MAEGDTIRRTARRIEAAVGGQDLSVIAGNGRGRAAGVERLDGRRLERVEARGKHLLFHFGDLVLHSHLGMSGSWRAYRHGERWAKPASAAWVVLRGDRFEAVQFSGPTLRVLGRAKLSNDPTLSRLGPDILAPRFDESAAIASLRQSPAHELGEALLDQRLITGIGNIFKSEACFAARADPWRSIAAHSDEELRGTLSAARRLMRDSAARGRADPAVYRRAGRPCPTCGTPIAARGQGDANRRTYWCPRCQTGASRAK
ncbi:MAG TPA: DNA-formamidopyrimidine glycosylase family protein [Solirubrobacterales bacterium]|nr:DNA-formamidopyrimidine glycosylase family protein [Solirubrobacterales bacterium]